jgi:hypothetical protein
MLTVRYARREPETTPDQWLRDNAAMLAALGAWALCMVCIAALAQIGDAELMLVAGFGP